MKVNGTLINYYFHCRRQCFLHGNRLNLEDNSEEVKVGKVIHEERAEHGNAEIAIENIRLDKLTKDYLTEIKKSDADVEAAKWQLLFYLKVLKSKGIIRKGKLEFVEKNKGNKKIMILELNDETEQKLEHCFRKDGKNIYIPIENTKEIYCLNEVGINSKLLDFLGQNNIVVHFFNYYGGYSGTFYPKDQYMSGKLLIKQVEAFQNNRMKIAKAIVKGIGINIYEVLYHYYKHNKKEVKDTIDWIKKDFYIKAEHVNDTKQLMSLEGELWMRFYNDFQYFLPEDFIMNKRVKRPPDNPMNSMVSFGNTLLYTKTISAIYRTHLDQRISFLHEPSEGRFSLSLDLSEVFKPVIVYRTIFDLVNNRKIQVEKHFDKKVNYCLLNDDGRKTFIEAFEGRRELVFQHPVLKRKVTYRTALKLDCYKLIKEIMEKKEFVPFSLKEGY